VLLKHLGGLPNERGVEVNDNSQVNVIADEQSGPGQLCRRQIWWPSWGDRSARRRAFAGHAEEEVVDAVDANIKAAGLKPADLDGETLNIHISKETGVCNNCAAGLPESSRAKLGAGPLKQLSDKYPGLTIRVTAEGGKAYAGREVLEIRHGKIIN
jgi:hypothetical protein